MGQPAGQPRRGAVRCTMRTFNAGAEDARPAGHCRARDGEVDQIDSRAKKKALSQAEARYLSSPKVGDTSPLAR